MLDKLKENIDAVTNLLSAVVALTTTIDTAVRMLEGQNIIVLNIVIGLAVAVMAYLFGKELFAKKEKV